MPEGGPPDEDAVPVAQGPGRRERVASDDAFVVHTRPWKETSLVIDLITRSHGRIVAVGKGARRPGSQLRPLLMPFQPLAVSWSGKGEVKLIRSVEWLGGSPQLSGVALMCGFYLNELLAKALAREDPHEDVFDAYRNSVKALATEPFHAGILRRFEASLLSGLGYGLVLGTEADTGAPVVAEGRYRYLPERGAVAAGSDLGVEAGVVAGRTLLDMARGDFADPVTAAESKRIMRMLLQHHLGGLELRSRQLLTEPREP